MSDWQLKPPVAFIIFNRPDTTERVFAEIAKAKPPKLLVVADGPRENRAGEAEKCAATRAIIDRVDWDCEVLRNYSDRNLGCKRRVSGGIDWVFEQVEEAIILEDDCLPDPTFFRFCQEMLERYRHDARVGMISGNNFFLGKFAIAESYYFSRYTHIWGWATWRNRWQGMYDVDMTDWPRVRDEDELKAWVGQEAHYWAESFEKTYRGHIDTWDHQWSFCNFAHRRLSVMPAVNLISNIGFGVEATHTIGIGPLANLPTMPIRFPLTHPHNLQRHQVADAINYKHTHSSTRLWRRILGRIKLIVKKYFNYAS
ncbi:MAG: glycosyltransferase family 2 protein [Nitrospira sp.]|nr:glycosyltransferase family 2 protein [Nitrospira sp.]